MALSLHLKKKIEAFIINIGFPMNILMCCHSLNPLVRDKIKKPRI